MNLKSILDRINLVTRSRFAANSNAAWLIWAKDILLEIDGIHAGPSRLVNIGVRVSSTGIISMPDGISGISNITVDGINAKYEINRRGAVITDSDIVPLSANEKSETWNQNGFMGSIEYDPAFDAINSMKGYTITDGYRATDIISSSHTSYQSYDQISFETSSDVGSITLANATIFTTNTRLIGYEKTKAPDTVTEDIDIDKDWAPMLAAGIWYMAENDMDPAGADAKARLKRYKDLQKAYIANENFAPGRSGKKSFQFTPRRNK